ncbi:MAG: hypothetical protein F4079_02830 [Candidatus Dadabacteria bacterium]|nr:hypothetical protein [Candidatus Dadabacteria bacterium]
MERAIATFSENSMLSAKELKAASNGQLAALIRPCGYHKTKPNFIY